MENKHEGPIANRNLSKAANQSKETHKSILKCIRDR